MISSIPGGVNGGVEGMNGGYGYRIEGDAWWTEPEESTGV
jgi:hypothetical protein